MAKAKSTPRPKISAEQILDSYIDYVLTNDGRPQSVYAFAKLNGMSEAEFYQYYASFDAMESAVWYQLTKDTLDVSKAQDIWPQYASREKVLSFFYSYIELLKSRRSFVLYSWKNKDIKLGTPPYLQRTKELFMEFADQVLEEGIHTGELADRKFFAKRYRDALWLQFKFIVSFWTEDNSTDFEKTDEAIERGVNVTFDLFQHSPLDNLFEYGKFLTQNSKLKEKFGL